MVFMKLYTLFIIRFCEIYIVHENVPKINWFSFSAECLVSAFCLATFFLFLALVPSFVEGDMGDLDRKEKLED